MQEWGCRHREDEQRAVYRVTMPSKERRSVTEAQNYYQAGRVPTVSPEYPKVV